MEQRTEMASQMALAGAARAAVDGSAPSPVWSIQGGLRFDVLGHVNFHLPANARYTKTSTIRWSEEALT
jgi:hypothetical protein